MTIFSEPKMTGFQDIKILEFLGHFDDMKLIDSLVEIWNGLENVVLLHDHHTYMFFLGQPDSWLIILSSV